MLEQSVHRCSASLPKPLGSPPKNRLGLRRVDALLRSLTLRLAKYPLRSLLLAVEAVKVEKPLMEYGWADEQSLRGALGSIGGRLVARADGAVYAVAISADNRWLVTGSNDKTARPWLLQMKDLVDLARAIVGRKFFADKWQLSFPGEKYRKTFPDLPGPD